MYLTTNFLSALGPKRLTTAFALVSLLWVTGCATVQHPNPNDPLESYNRSMFGFNDVIDRNIAKPIATGYKDVTPKLVREGVTNFFANLGDVWSFVNNILQLKPQEAGESLMRVSVNTVFGLGGLIDVASAAQIPRHKEDFGLTLARYGIGTGPYVVLPLLGPSTVRDTVALPVDWYGDPLAYMNNVALRNTLIVTQIVNRRANLLSTSDLLEAAALDRYSFVRDSYMQLRRARSETPSQVDAGGEIPPVQ